MTQTNSTMPLFYKKPEPLDSSKHKTLALKKSFGLDFTRKINAVPVTMIEMPQICHSYPIAFSQDANATPVAILGLRDNENLFIDEKGNWEPLCYIPSYIRRYPFIFSENPQNDQLVLCVDTDKSVIEEGGDQRFFEEDGTASALSKNALEFCKSYHAAAHQTTAFGQALDKAGLLVERSAEIMAPNGKKINFSGFRIIDETKLMELDDATFMEFRKNGWLPFIYAHLFSGSQWQKLTALLAQHLEKSAA
ncbi:MAG: SapC family protein [Alphaproteobacteria bacterium]|nr:SapC family protein [Alphaproteobacteria bacterium]MCB9985244.1 SapC family protein [Micavibrio sp.]